MSLACGVAAGWATINAVDLQNDSNSYIKGTSFTDSQMSIIISIVNIGSLIGNFAVAPMSRLVGIKHTIHYLVVLLIVSYEFTWLSKCSLTNLNNIMVNISLSCAR